jgi:AsmA protein
MKKVLIALGVILVLLVGAVVALPFFIPVDTIKEEVVAAARDATGRELSIKGDVSFKPFPRFEVEVGDVSFANAEGASDPNMAEIQKLLVQVQVLPLLSGQVRVDSFVLEKPVIHLEIDKNGKANYVFESGEATEAAETTGEQEAAGGEMTVPDISLGDVRLVDGLVTYSDLRSGQRMEISAINMTVSLPDMASPFSAKGSLDWQGETIELTLNSDGLQELLAGPRNLRFRGPGDQGGGNVFGRHDEAGCSFPAQPRRLDGKSTGHAGRRFRPTEDRRKSCHGRQSLFLFGCDDHLRPDQRHRCLECGSGQQEAAIFG